MKIRRALATVAVTVALAGGLAAAPAMAAAPDNAARSASAPSETAAGQWLPDASYWLYDRCMDAGWEYWGSHGIPYRCDDLGWGRWMLMYWREGWLASTE